MINIKELFKYRRIVEQLPGGSGGSGGGGGSLPAGVYLSASFANQHVNYPNRRFVLNGELYATNSGYLSGGYLSYIYKWDGSKWATLLSSSSSTGGVNGTKIDSVDYCVVEFNGKMHFLNSNHHATFDGKSFVNLNDLPYYTSGSMCCCVYNNKLIAYMYDSGKLFEWNESGDTWTEIATLASNTYTYYNIFVVNDVLYIESSKKIYSFNNGVLEQYGTTNNSTTNGVVRNNKVYSINIQTYHSELHEYDPITNTSKTFTLPSFRYVYFTYGGDEFSFIGNTGSASSGTFRFPCFVIHEVT
jgi:hypothetical protein